MSKGRVYRRCSCRDDDGRQLGAHCPVLLSDRKHGSWTFAVDVPSVDGRRKTMRRGGYPTKGAAQRALPDVLARYGAGVRVDRPGNRGRLPRGLAGREAARAQATTMHRYSEIITKELVPAFGALPLEQLRHDHVTALVTELEAAGRGAPTIRYVHAVLSSALADAVRQRRLTHNVAEHTALPRCTPPSGSRGRPPKQSRSWTTATGPGTGWPTCSSSSSAPGSSPRFAVCA